MSEKTAQTPVEATQPTVEESKSTVEESKATEGNFSFSLSKKYKKDIHMCVRACLY